MELKLTNTSGEEVGTVEVRDDVFAVPMNETLVHQVMVGQMANRRQGTARVKPRSEVSGGGAKPRPQKYTGRSRQGSIRSPLWKGGGIVFGPTPRSYAHHTPKRMKRRALVTVLSDKARQDRLTVLDKLELGQGKTKEMVQVLDAVGINGGSTLLVADGAGPEVLRAARNVPKFKMLPAALLNAADLLNVRQVIMTLDAVRKAEELWGGPFVRGGKKAASESVEE